MRKISIIGAGASGCFCAIEIKRRHPDACVTVYETGPVPLAKVAVTGGGRCNFTNSFEGIRSIKEAYPRGEKLMKRALKVFSNTDCIEWFRKEGVPSVIQDDCCVFPESQDAMQIVETLESLMHRLGVRVKTNSRIASIESLLAESDAVIVTTGGGVPSFLDGLGLDIEPPVPSLFTFRINDRELTSLMGTVVENASLRIAGEPFRSCGALLVTDWGFSGPVTLKLSSYAARYLARHQYKAALSVNWTGEDEEGLRAWIQEVSAANGGKLIANTTHPSLTSRLWRFLLSRAGLREDLRWSEAGQKSLNRLVSVLTSDEYRIEGRCRFKEEFVTCGGVALSNVDSGTLECKKIPGLYFAGEVLDIDAITGGFNLQAAWSTAMMVARSL